VSSLALKNNFELMAPGGDIDSIKAAIAAGANAVYCGLDNFNARQRAKNLIFEDLNGILKLAHKNDCKVFLTLNIIILESEIPALIRLLNKVVKTKVDGVIVQDLGLFYLLSKYFKSLEVHASTQFTTHNKGQVCFLNELEVSRVNLSRELNIREIKALTQAAHEKNILTEVFVHGSFCIGFSGLCYLSSVISGNSGNRGRCSQPCRDRYLTTTKGKEYPLNLKDNSAFFYLKELSEAGVDSLKIEGRIKKFHYVYTVVNCWKKQIQSFHNQDGHNTDNIDLYKVFNRDFSSGYLKGEIHKNMFIDDPRDNSVKHLSERISNSTHGRNPEKDLYDEKIEIITTAKDKIKDLSIEKTSLSISISGKLNTPLKVSIKTPDTSFLVLSESKLINADQFTINYKAIEKRFKSLNDSEYTLNDLDLENLQSGLFIPFKELTAIRNKVSFLLNGSKKIIAPIEIPVLNKQSRLKTRPALSVLISSEKDLGLCHKTSADIYYQLPSGMKSKYSELVDLFLKNKNLIPWFPSILIGEDYTRAVEFLEQVRPKRLVTNNAGIACNAYEKEISWIAGPCLNIMNSFSLLCLKEKFNCGGSFISNEINKNQIKQIISPDNFKLYYSIYHPILLLSSRQCLFHQITGCEKEKIDEACLQDCKKSASIENLKEVSFLIDKQKGDYPCLYSHTHFLNTDILTDLPNLFSGFFIDLRNVRTETKIKKDKAEIIRLFENLLNKIPGSTSELKQNIHLTTNAQYQKGL
jgi:putative protease